MDEKTMLQARHLSHWFGEGELQSQVLNDVSLELGEGEMTLVMGPSGSGKSTLLAIISGLLRPCAGNVTAQSQDIWELSDPERRAFRLKYCGFIFQGYNLFPSLTAQEQLEMVLQWGEGVSQSAAKTRAVEVLELLGLGGKGNLLPCQLSGGEKQRVAIGRALIKKPTFCFADEPTSALDWKHGEQVVELLRSAARDLGATIFIVAHESRIIPYADHAYSLMDGVLSTQELREEVRTL